MWFQEKPNDLSLVRWSPFRKYMVIPEEAGFLLHEWEMKGARTQGEWEYHSRSRADEPLVNLIGEPSWCLLGKTPLWRNCHVTGAKPLGWVLRSTLFILSLVVGWVMLHFVFLSVTHDSACKSARLELWFLQENKYDCGVFGMLGHSFSLVEIANFSLVSIF